MITAEEFWSEVISSENEFSMLTELKKTGLHKHVFEAMRRFAKLHVEEAKKQFLENAETKILCQHGYGIFDEDSILNAYPLTNIK